MTVGPHCWGNIHTAHWTERCKAIVYVQSSLLCSSLIGAGKYPVVRKRNLDTNLATKCTSCPACKKCWGNCGTEHVGGPTNVCFNLMPMPRKGVHSLYWLQGGNRKVQRPVCALYSCYQKGFCRSRWEWVQRPTVWLSYLKISEMRSKPKGRWHWIPSICDLCSSQAQGKVRNCYFEIWV